MQKPLKLIYKTPFDPEYSQSISLNSIEDLRSLCRRHVSDQRVKIVRNDGQTMVLLKDGNLNPNIGFKSDLILRWATGELKYNPLEDV